ncbi:hypothetical protein [Brevundimonas sp.]|uniref:hypothetical protein n=1 Tax=Brevundimonas sp. TaxID=1871086 RepID=UPI0035B09588
MSTVTPAPIRRSQVGDQILAQLLQTENAIDQALIETAAFMHLLPSLRLQQNYSAVLAAPAIARITRAAQALSESRTEMVAAHGDLAAAAPAIGLGAYAMGTGQPKEEPIKTGFLATGSGETSLRAVG